MKLTAILLLAACLQVSAHSEAQVINLSVKNAPFEKVLKEIKKQTGYTFIYGADLISKGKKVTLKVSNASIEKVLELVFEGQPFSYKITEKYVVVSPKETAVVEPKVPEGTTTPPPIDIKGRVVNEAGEPVEGASITIKGTDKGTSTNQEGYFSLAGVDETATLVISGASIQKYEIRANTIGALMAKADNGIALIATKIRITEQEEVIVNAGYYDVKKKEATGSISRVDAKTIEKQPVTNPLAALHGRMPGVQIQQTSGVPGSPFKIEIRGRNSLRDEGNEPLYVIDGVPFSSQTLSASTNTQGIINGGISPLTSINSADIESIEVLKDADATAIYGSRGANGVVLITTKKGKAGKTKFDVIYYSGFSKVHLVKQLNTDQYLSMRREAFALEGLTPTANPNDNGTVNSNYRAYAPDLMVWDTTRYTDWQKYFLGRTAITSSLQNSISGGNENTQFLAGIGYFKETSVFPGNFNFRKISSHLSINHKTLDKKFFFNVSINGSNDLHSQPQADYAGTSRAIAPNAPKLYDEDGSLNWENSTWNNPLADFEKVYDATVNCLVTNTTVGYEVLPGIKSQIKAGFTRRESSEVSIYPSTMFDPAFGIGSESSSVNTSNGETQSWIIEPQLNWEKKIAKGQLALLVGGTYQQEYRQLAAFNYSDFPSNTLLYDISTAANKFVWDYDKSVYKYAAAFARLNYNWNKKYIVNLTGRRDGSSRFGPGRQFANFGAVGLAWIFSNEKWMKKKVTWLSFGKIRGSYGITGSDQIGDYQYLDTYATPQRTGNSYNGITALDPIRLFNPVFGWENNSKMEVALDLGFLNDRLLIHTAWYRNRTSNQLVNYTLPTITGFSGILSNLPATVQNSGVEIELASTNIKSINISWTTSLNISIPRNELVEFPNIDSSSYANRYIVGQSIYIQKFYEYVGINPQTGLYTVRDKDNDGKISFPNDESSAVFVGQDFFGGVSNRLTYKAWTFDIFFQVVKQTGKLTTFLAGYRNLNIPEYFLELNRWQKNGDQPEIQRFATEYSVGFGSTVANSSYEHFNLSNASVTDASFVRLKTMSLEYELPAKAMKGMDCRVYLRGQNLFVFTRYKGSDPETQTGSKLPPLKSVTVGINITL